MPAIYLLHNEGSNVGEGGKQCYFHVALSRHAFQYCGQPEGNAITPSHRAEVTACKKEHIAVPQCLPDAIGADAFLSFLLLLKLSGNPQLLVIGEPASLMRPVGQEPDGNNSQDDCRNSFDDEQPAPAPYAEPGEAEKQAGQRRSDYVGDWIGCVEKCNGFGSILIAKPVG